VTSYWTYPEGFAASFVAKKLNIPMVVRPRGSDINFFKQYLPFRLLIKFVLKRANTIIPVCNDLGENITNLGIPKEMVQCIPFGVDTQRFKAMDRRICRETIGIGSETTALLFIGNLLEVKGIDYLLESLKFLEQKKIRNLELNIIGSGPLREKYLSKARHFEMCRINLRGEVPNSEIPIWMNASDLFCLPSISEGYPNVLMEAMACGLPVVATRVGGIHEIIDSAEHGILVSPKNPMELSEAILSAMNRKWKKKLLIKKGMDNDWQTASDRIYKIFKELTDKAYG
jgi:glycosyltransferase involved in cell wall biosynthesis